MKYVLDGYCGLYCGACPMLLQAKAGENGEGCHGCKSGQSAGHCLVCEIKACAREKGYDFCDKCPSLDTCDKMIGFIQAEKYPYHQAVLKNMKDIRRYGLPVWLSAQDARWRCANCGTSHSWWDEVCPTCGQPVANYEVDIIFQ